MSDAIPDPSMEPDLIAAKVAADARKFDQRLAADDERNGWNCRAPECNGGWQRPIPRSLL